MGANSRNIQYFNILFDRNVMVRSTDSDLLFVYLGVHQQFDAAGIRVIIQFNSPGAHFRKYVDCSKLVSELRNDARADISLLGNGISVPHALCLLHYMSGCDDISHTRAFTKLFCTKTLLKYGSFVFGIETSVRDLVLPTNLQALIGVNVRFIIALYANKYANCFEQPLAVTYQNSNLNDQETLTSMLEQHRKVTWHKTIHIKNTVPSYQSVVLRTRRLLYAVQKIFNALTPLIESWNIQDWGWIIDGGTIKTQVISIMLIPLSKIYSLTEDYLAKTHPYSFK